MLAMKGHALIVLAGGSGARMGAGINKQLLTLGGSTITEIALKQLLSKGHWEQVVLVAAKKDWDAISGVAHKVSIECGVAIDQVAGGTERQFSVANGIGALKPEIHTVWIHDGARPFVESDLIARLALAIDKENAVIPALPSKDTLKRVVAEVVQSTLKRSEIFRIQTPQCFKRDLLENMQKLNQAEGDFTDDASMAEALGIDVHVVLGSEWNIKLTTPEDMITGSAIYEYLKGVGKCV